MRSKKEFLYVFASVLLSFILFINASSFNFQNNSSARQVSSETYTNTLTNIPIDAKYNNKTYFVSGLTSEVTVFLKGSNRVALASEMQPGTRKFRVVADLRKAKEGTVEVPLIVEDLPAGLTATVEPQKVSVKIGKKAKKSFAVRATIPDNQIVDGITVTDISLETTKVEVTSDQETLSRIDHVEAVFPSSEIISGNYSGTISLNAVDAQGNVLPGLVKPSETRIKVTTKSSSSTSSSSSSSSTSSSSSN